MTLVMWSGFLRPLHFSSSIKPPLLCPVKPCNCDVTDLANVRNTILVLKYPSCDDLELFRTFHFYYFQYLCLKVSRIEQQLSALFTRWWWRHKSLRSATTRQNGELRGASTPPTKAGKPPSHDPNIAIRAFTALLPHKRIICLRKDSENFPMRVADTGTKYVRALLRHWSVHIHWCLRTEFIGANRCGNYCITLRLGAIVAKSAPKRRASDHDLGTCNNFSVCFL